jgi:hypothetical protein
MTDPQAIIDEAAQMLREARAVAELAILEEASARWLAKDAKFITNRLASLRRTARDTGFKATGDWGDERHD